MGRMISKKLRSSKGASLTFALLAFLVCAVISAVLLASASAASGRLSNLAESDQRYYAVTSAAQLFCDTLEGQEFTIERTKVSYSSSRQNYIIIGSQAVRNNDPVLNADIPTDLSDTCTNTILLPTSLVASGTSNLVDITDNVDAVMQTGFLAEAAIKFAIDGQTSDGAWGITPRLREYQWTMQITADKAAAGISVQIDVDAIMAKDGTITLTFTNHEATVKNPFSVIVTLAASIEDNSTAWDVNVSERVFPKDITEYGYNMVTLTTKTEKKTTKISWTVTDIKKVSA